MTETPKYAITIGRTFGSGGRALGKILAERLGIKYYDKELLLEAAEKAGLSPEFFEKNDERTPQFLTGIIPLNFGYNPIGWYNGPTSISSDSIHKAQCEFIREIAMAHPCVIVGRSADYVLRDVSNVINVFVHAPIEECVKRIVARGERLTAEQARTLAEKTNKLRANYYNFYTDKRWGDARSYDLTFDSSKLPLDDIADIIITYLNRRLKQR